MTDYIPYLTGRLINAWTETPTKWYPLPLAVGALLLVAMQYRKRAKRAQAQLEADLNENGYEVIKLKGPWQVGLAYLHYPSLFPDNGSLTGPCYWCFATQKHVPSLGLCQFLGAPCLVPALWSWIICLCFWL